jgi:hypothetical protein
MSVLTIVNMPMGSSGWVVSPALCKVTVPHEQYYLNPHSTVHPEISSLTPIEVTKTPEGMWVFTPSPLLTQDYKRRPVRYTSPVTRLINKSSGDWPFAQQVYLGHCLDNSRLKVKFPIESMDELAPIRITGTPLEEQLDKLLGAFDLEQKVFPVGRKTRPTFLKMDLFRTKDGEFWLYPRINQPTKG